MVPSLALKLVFPPRIALACPRTPNLPFCASLLVMLARIAESGIASMRPAPRVGVGIRNTIFELPPWPLSGISRRRKDRLLNIAAAARIGAPGDHEEIVHTPVGYAIGLHESRFPDGPGRSEEPRNDIRCALGDRDAQKRILRRAAAADIGLRMTGCATIRIEARAEAVARGGSAYGFYGVESRNSIIEKG